jgi:hypothetical protein
MYDMIACSYDLCDIVPIDIKSSNISKDFTK